MSYANPYAAPQTLESTLDVRKLPMATLASSGMLRRELPAVSTQELARLVRQSRALDDMQLVWMWLMPMILLGVFVWWCVEDFDNAAAPFNYVPLAIAATVCLTRIVLGHGRSQVGRYTALFIDAPVVAASVVGMTVAMRQWFYGTFAEQVTMVLCLALLSLPVSFGYKALVAMLEARVLFGSRRCQHGALVEELDYRRELGIE